MVELQRNVPDFERNGIAVFAVSYDSVAALGQFALKHGITFTLLSDAGSKVIRELGLFDERVYEHHAEFGFLNKAEKYLGVAYPGEILLNEQGIVIQKRFQKNYRERESGQTILEQGFGVESMAHGSEAETRAEAVGVRAFLDSDHYRIYQRLRINCELAVPAGWHVYGLPIPEGYVPLTVAVTPMSGLAVEGAVLPPPHPFRIQGSDEQFFVYDGKVRCSVPVLFTKNVGDQVVQTTVRFQACSSSDCRPPSAVTLALPVKAEKLIDAQF